MANLKTLIKGIIPGLILVLLAACGERTDLAPVVELKWQPQDSHRNTHIVRRDETLYSIAFRYDRDFRQLAAYNRIRFPYQLRVGQIIHLPYANAARSPANKAKNAYRIPARPAVNRQKTHIRQYHAAQGKLGGKWLWPARGRIVSGFIPEQGKKGIDIAGRKGEAVRASAAGIVAYAGNGLAGYGNLIIIKHDGQYLTAYGNNARNLVREGQKVKAGEIIAEMGIIDRKFLGVHFEIRKSGQPVNPLAYLRKE
ncbi:peptidoglycan DD-metalloendopeptidase family protein [Legionella dresdenensis]|uniref:Peptidoglycan DD-metalloendopeptidase family protein n=1 Tax=Legionella dresdenensis TaxID=450200 RepID=A0ABV8CH05_9GAMM